MIARQFAAIDGGNGAAESDTLRLLQWNILADGLAGLQENKGDFAEISDEHIAFNYRKHLCLQEFDSHQPDVITLQEVDHFDDFFFPALLERDYQGTFIPKTPSVCLRVSSKPDGVAVFTRRDKLDVLFTEAFQFLSADRESCATQAAIIVVVRLTGSPDGKSVLIATTHLKATKNNAGEAIRHDQATQLLRRIEELKLALNISSVIISGDFNADPVVYDGYDPLTFSAIIAHGYRSVYNDFYKDRSDLWTTWKIREKNGKRTEVKHTIDYIFLSPDLRGTRLLDIPQEADVPPGRLPAATYPSDHLSLVADIAV